MQIFSICTKRIFEKDGVVKTKWYKAGIMKITDKGNRYIRLFHQPETEFYIFDVKPMGEIQSE
ncbi:MAG: hypothetical protein HY841_05445 [Bacteroidetes bacterium]|nr:hypothetical protein [Bacteroidota bacterium]